MGDVVKTTVSTFSRTLSGIIGTLLGILLAAFVLIGGCMFVLNKAVSKNAAEARAINHVPTYQPTVPEGRQELEDQAAQRKRQQELRDQAAEQERKQEIEGLRSRKAVADELKKVEVKSARFYWQKDDFMPKPVIELSIVNGTSYPISRAYFRGVLVTPGRSIPWVDETFNYSVAGGVEPGEEVRWSLAPNMFGAWGNAPRDRKDMVLTAKVTEIEGPGGKSVLKDDFTEADAARLAELESGT